MGNYFDFQSKQSDQITLNIHPDADFREVLQILESIQFPDFVENADNIKYAVLELISNSLRAHREKKVDKQVMAVFRAEDTRIDVEVKDFGGGFDPKRLPYSLDAPIETIDQTSDEFEKYQKKHNFLRFGMGLLITRKTFRLFELIFFDEDEQPVEWGEGRVNGTMIRVSTQED
ncbi:MAG: ATP-binding protein [Spirochaetia bacterium]|jgi:anti-sigma regulatory factor (Ser/Thr protein kinase)